MEVATTSRISKHLLTLVLVIGLHGCSEPTGSGAEPATEASGSEPFARRAGEPRRIPESAALPPELRDKLCSLRRNAREADLVRRFGEPTQRHGSVEQGILALTWHSDTGSVSASFGASGTLELAAASGNMKPMRGNMRQTPVDLSGLEPGKTSLADVEELLDRGVLTKATWHKGLEISQADAVRRGLPADIGEDRCEMLYTWLVPGRARPLTVGFDQHNMATPNAIAAFSSQ